jgi:hypothetical protein
MKPLYGTQQYVTWLGFDEYDNEWTCHVCGTIMGGQRIRTCTSCNAYPLWKYNASVFVVGKAYLKIKIASVLGILISFLASIKEKIEKEQE